EQNLALMLLHHLQQRFPAWEQLATPPPPPGGLALNQLQNQAVKTALVSPVSLITGGPGVGKTTVVRRLVQLAQENHWQVKLAAPTGRAAKRLAEATGMADAATIHRLLKFDPQTRKFSVNRDTPLECDLLVVDEVSMLDLPLATALLAAVPDRARLVLVGDKDQLPSVGPGAVLHDLLESQCIPVVALTQIYRQAEGSRIVANAHAINRGVLPDLDNPPRGTAGEFYFYPREQPEECQRFLVELCAKSIPEFFGWNPMEDIQVLTPMRKGECGTIVLNRVLQEKLNPPSPEKPELTLAGEEPQRIFRLGDRVMQTKNNYDKQVFNGDLGRIVSLNRQQRTFRVAFDRETVEYNATDCSQLLHAYAITIHKAQGCEFPAVVVPLLRQHSIMLQRNLLYTAVTRARKLFILAGDRQAIHWAVGNDKPVNRNTRLAWRLQNPKASPLEHSPLTPQLPWSTPQ
ncbi:MAG: ATP-dependent RecD-like DNA helicase, partial [Oligosphaeraceae bacterium]